MKASQAANILLRQSYRHLGRPLLFRSFGGDPERIHEVMISVLSKLPAAKTARQIHPVEIAGIAFPSRVGVAAGLDKDGKAAHAWARFGFGFAELGTVTARAQPGNPQPRLFRLPSSRAVINRMGFNNHGAAALAASLRERGLRRGSGPIPLGISIGKSKVVPLPEAINDYLASLAAVTPVADYVAINVSSPNTPGLRDLQESRELARLLGALRRESDTLTPGDPVPIFVKLAPDLLSGEVSEIVKVVTDSGAAGFIATNTTLSRDGLRAADAPMAEQSGGLSGAPLNQRALAFVAGLRELTALPIIGVGGIMTPGNAAAMFDAGADLVQIYTGFIYEGPALVHGINHLI